MSKAKTQSKPELLDMESLLRHLHLAEPADTTSVFRVSADAFLIGGAMLALAREVRLLREEVAIVHGVIDDSSSALERCVDRLADVTEGA